jgi:hypothetical protein
VKKLAILAAILTLVLIVAGCNKASTSGTEDQQSGGFAPQAPPSAPGAAPAPAGPPTVVAEGKTIEEHVIDYFEAYKEQRLEEAFELAPAETKAKQPIEEFVSSRKGMPISDYSMLPTSESGDSATIRVEYTLTQFGTWVSTWSFEKQGDKWVALRFKADPKQ